MIIQPFTPTGLSAKLAELYALTDADLLTQAKLIANDFKSFMGTNFSFTSDQAIYLGSFDAHTTFTIGSQMAAGVALRANITMDNVPPNPTEPRRPKEIRPGMTGDISYVDGPYSGLSGTLEIHISWELH